MFNERCIHALFANGIMETYTDIKAAQEHRHKHLNSIAMNHLLLDIVPSRSQSQAENLSAMAKLIPPGDVVHYHSLAGTR